MKTLIEKIIEKQKEKQLTNAQFARLVGISESMWRSVRSGERQVGNKTLNGVLVTFPELDKEILAFIRHKNGKKTPPQN